MLVYFSKEYYVPKSLYIYVPKYCNHTPKCIQTKCTIFQQEYTGVFYCKSRIFSPFVDEEALQVWYIVVSKVWNCTLPASPIWYRS
jgi:hypothetical protein